MDNPTPLLKPPAYEFLICDDPPPARVCLPTRMINPTKLSQLSERYLATLRTHFEQGPRADARAAHRLGKQAFALGLQTLQLAKIHKLAVGNLVLSGYPIKVRKDMSNRAAAFFTAASALIAKTRLPAGAARAQLDRLNASLTARTQEVKESRRKLQAGIARRQNAEAALKTSREASGRLLEEARHLQRYLQDMAHAVFSAREKVRKTMSHTLQDEIAQTLLGIQFRLMALKKEVSVSNEDFEKEIAITQQLVEKSAYTLKHFARALGHPDEK